MENLVFGIHKIMIYLKLKQEPKTIEELLTELFSHKSNSGDIKSVETYKDKEYTIIDCDEDKYRSVDDLVEIVQTYFPDATPKEIFRTLIELKIYYDDDTYRLCMLNCDKINRPTMSFSKRDTIWGFDDDDDENEYFTNELFKSEYKNWGTVCYIAEIDYTKLDEI